MRLLLAALAILPTSGLLALAARRRPAWASGLGVGGSVLACLIGLGAALRALAIGGTATFRLPWMASLGGEFVIRLDSLAAFFLIPLFVVCGAAAVFGGRYLLAHGPDRRIGAAWFFYPLLVASMVLVVTAGNGLLFLVAWEIMALASFFLVTYDHNLVPVRQAGRLYLMATHLGTVFLIVFFLVMARAAGTLDFAGWAGVAGRLSPRLAGALFLCALAGFGTKAGFMPLHIWLPEAHPAAPSHVSAVMSGVMIKTGIYGLIRFLPCLGAPPAWWGATLIAIGLSSGILGVLFAVAQHDVKRLLAYSSVENIGIIALGLGIGLLGLALGIPLVAALGFAGALLHTFNHALFKSLLFLGAGAVYTATGTREIDRLGGLLKRMPSTGAWCLVGCAAIGGLPPLNGFVGEFLIYAAAISGAVYLGAADVAPFVAVVAGLALIGGLAAACFAKVFGIVFLGEPRSADAAGAAEVPWAMRLPLIVLAVGCLAIGLMAPCVVESILPVVGLAMGTLPAKAATVLAPVMGPLTVVSIFAAAVLLLVLVLAAVRRLMLRRRDIRPAGTWDCGYARPTARMQYTGSSFAHPIVGLFSRALRSRSRTVLPTGYFPQAGSLETETRDVFRERLFTPLFHLVDRWLSLLKWVQAGRVQLYVLYIVVTLVVLLLWTLRIRA